MQLNEGSEYRADFKTNATFFPSTTKCVYVTSSLQNEEKNHDAKLAYKSFVLRKFDKIKIFRNGVNVSKFHSART
jgi:hypothetical protein